MAGQQNLSPLTATKNPKNGCFQPASGRLIPACFYCGAALFEGLLGGARHTVRTCDPSSVKATTSSVKRRFTAIYCHCFGKTTLCSVHTPQCRKFQRPGTTSCAMSPWSWPPQEKTARRLQDARSSEMSGPSSNGRPRNSGTWSVPESAPTAKRANATPATPSVRDPNQTLPKPTERFAGSVAC